MLLFLALSALYYYKERSRLFQEEKVKNRLIYSECMHMSKIMKMDQECKMPIIEDIKALENTWFEIVVAFFIVLLLILPAAYFLSMISLRPMHDSIETIDSFINGIVHDINTPLSVIKLNAQSIHAHLENEKEREKSNRIFQGVEDIESLEEQLLFSLKSDKYVLKRSTLDISALLQSRLSFYNDVRDSVSVELSASSLNIKADSSIFIRMIDNIILNAIKFSHRDSKVLISIKDTILTIEDFGNGIKNRKKVFMKYYREDGARKGLGLGLYIVKSVADLHNIEIELESQIGVGSRFIIDLKSIKVD